MAKKLGMNGWILANILENPPTTMKRDIYPLLKEWQKDPQHFPLILRGARQVGKSYIVNEFGLNEFDSLITLNFEKNPEYKEIFKSFDPSEIIERITLFTNKRIVPGKTLLFLDEVQECPSAIMSLRYFFEEKQSLHIIAAGSLLEFVLKSEEFRMPVGRIQYMYLFPLSFGEFLDTQGEGQLRNLIKSQEELEKVPDALHIKLNEYLRKYFLIGGMPAVVDRYIKQHDFILCQRIQRGIVDTFLDDFGKYARKTKHNYLSKIFYAVPKMIGNKFKYSHVDRSIKSRELKDALELLEMAGIVRRINHTSGAGIPLEAGIKEGHFKVLFLDIGLLHAINGIYADTAVSKDYTTLFNGSVAEQFVGQELVAYQNPYSKPSLYYWAREAKNSNAEIDYLIQKKSTIVPVEVKSGSIGRMKSMFMFLESYNSNYGLKISQARYSKSDEIVCLPMYALQSIMK
ncbi:MAG: ATP-binding protein [Proteobacteria bacterium]|nr:ATP-binding protein [Pseudomonadota bacterium]